MPGWFTPTTLKPWLEVAALAATVVTGLASAFVVYQVWLAKATLLQAQKDLQVRSTRESIALAARQCEKYGGEMLVAYDAAMKFAASKGVKIWKWPLTNAAFGRDSLAQQKEAYDWIATVENDRDVQFRLTLILNSLEAFAMPFASGMAKEETAFEVVSNPFLEQIEAFAPLLITLREQTARGMTSGQFASVVRLYDIWSARRDAERVKAGLAKYMDEHRKLRKVEPITPIGTR